MKTNPKIFHRKIFFKMWQKKRPSYFRNSTEGNNIQIEEVNYEC